MIIETKKLSDLKPAPYNPRKSNEKQEANLKKSLEKFGVVEPIVFNGQTGYIVGGHFRVRELKKLGYKEVECVIVDLSKEDEKELNIRLNANIGEWDWAMLANDFELEQLEDWGLDVPDFNGVDYSDKNQEINVDEFEDEMILKLKFSKDDFLDIQDRLTIAKDRFKTESNEDTFKELLSFHERT